MRTPLKKHTSFCIVAAITVLMAITGCSSSVEPVFRVAIEDAVLGVDCVRFSPEAEQCLVARGTQITLVDSKLGTIVSQTELLSPDDVDQWFTSTEFSRDGSQLIVTGNSPSVQFLDPKNLNVLSEFGDFSTRPSFACEPPVGSGLVIMANSQELIRMAGEPLVKAWATETRFASDEAGVECSKRWIAIPEFDDDFKRQIGIYDIATGERLQNKIGHDELVTGIAFSPDESLIASVDKNGMLLVHTVESGELRWEIESDPHGAYAVVIHPDNDLIAVGCMRGIKIWSLKEKKLVASWNGHEFLVQSLQFSTDGKQLLSGSSDHSAALWNVDAVIGVLQYEHH